MALGKRYNPGVMEAAIAEQWRQNGVYAFERTSAAPVYSIDTPPPTVSGTLHLGHAFSYSHTDFVARFWRMRGYNVYYPMGFDDNGLPTERLVERIEGIRAEEVGREAFIERCLVISEASEAEYERLFRRLGLSVDWEYRYRTIARESRQLAQWSFVELYERGLIYRKRAPTIWCPLCHTALAQADVDDLQRQSTFHELAFELDNGEALPIATTRPELLPACVAIFVHPDDSRAKGLMGRKAAIPLFERQVPILLDSDADPQKGTGVVMCCTFGDTTDVEWWRRHELPLIEAVGANGEMLAPAGRYAGSGVAEARAQIVADLAQAGLLLGQTAVEQTVRVHERCDTPVEFIVSQQWFASLLPFKEPFLEAGKQIAWRPAHMQARYEQWVQNLGWDWCISRQRFFGVPFPVWHCDSCGEIIVADKVDLPVDPLKHVPGRPCRNCQGHSFTPDRDVMDTWATSSLSPQIAGRMLSDPDLYAMLFPYAVRPQAHEIIRTWAFYTISKSLFHFDATPWRNVAISGWGLAPKGTAKISKSRGGGPLGFGEALDRYSADAIRYWAASTGPGKDSVIDERKIEAGLKLATKLWNVARFSERFLAEEAASPLQAGLTAADAWILSRLQRLAARVTALMEAYDYASAKNEVEQFFWSEFADNYLEMAKKRLYDGGEEAGGARATLNCTLKTVLKLLAPFIPYVTEAIYRGLWPEEGSIHRSSWPEAEAELVDEEAELVGEQLVAIATAVRRYKSEANLSLGAELARLHIAAADEPMERSLRRAEPDLISITRARQISVNGERGGDLVKIGGNDKLEVAVVP